MSLQNAVPQAVFGPGSLYVTRIDIDDQTPYNIGYAQEFSYDEAGETKELYGQKQYPLVIARGTLKATGKMKAATLSGLALSAVFGGGSFTDGQLLMAQAESHIIPAVVTHATGSDTPSGATLAIASTTGLFVGQLVTGLNIPAQTFVLSFVASTSVTLTQAVTADVPMGTTLTFGPSIATTHSVDFDTDLGVLDSATTIPMLLNVTTALSTGQYTYTTIGGTVGVYSFAAADIADTALITYAYTNTSGQTFLVTNQNIGTTPAFQIDYVSELYGDSYYVRMFAAVSNKLTRSHKLTDFVMPEIDFGFFALGNGNVYEVSYSKKS